jgi:hypothetical protein
VTETTIDADLGNLGRISVTRRPTGRTKTVPRGCKPGARKRVPAERYEGTIEFHGEEGYTEVSATSAPLDDVTLCFTGGEGGRSPGKSLPGARIDVEKRSNEYELEFDASQRRPGARTAVKAEIDELRGEFAIERVAWAFAPAGALRYDRDLQTATLEPPAPFAGHATFNRNASRAHQWTGNLTVDFPGRSDVPLTGRGFWADLEHPH